MQAARNPASWIGAFQAAIDAGTEVTEEALSCIQQHVDGFRPEDFVPEPRDRAAVLRLLKPRPGLYARLSQMHDCGLLGRLFPEFQAISWRVVRDFYHKYTVDEHTLLTIRNFERLANTDEPSRQRFKAVAAGIPSPELLVLSLLLHDVGKWRDDEHALESERMAVDALDRLQVTGEARETVQFLIRNHLRMSLVAFRRDTEDPEIVKEFARLVGTEDRLKMLCLLTLADIEAVSPETLTPWKEELIWRLYVDTYNHLTQALRRRADRAEPGGPDRAARRPADGSARGGDHPFRRRAAAAIPAALPHGRPSTGTCALARDIRPDEVHLSLDVADSVWTLAVVTLDKPFLFSNICGVLSSFGMNILRGHALTNPERAGPRRLPVHRRRALPGAQPGRPAAGAARPAGGRLRTRRRHVAAARPRAERAAVARNGARRAGRPRRQRGVGALHDSRHHRRQRARACSTGSAV